MFHKRDLVIETGSEQCFLRLPPRRPPNTSHEAARLGETTRLDMIAHDREPTSSSNQQSTSATMLKTYFGLTALPIAIDHQQGHLANLNVLAEQ